MIYETENFIALAAKEPHISREEGGHIFIKPKTLKIDSRTDLTPKFAKEVFRLTMLVGEAMKIAMLNRGLKFVRINYQENGNWAYKYNKTPYFHIHLYGRTENSVMQKWPKSLYFPDRNTKFYDNNIPLNNEDIKEIQKQINILEKEDKYNLNNW